MQWEFLESFMRPWLSMSTKAGYLQLIMAKHLQNLAWVLTPYGFDVSVFGFRARKRFESFSSIIIIIYLRQVYSKFR